MDFLNFLVKRSDDFLEYGVQHLIVVGAAVIAATVLGVSLGILSFRFRQLRGPVLGITGAMLTIPSFALFVLMIPLLGLGTAPVVVALTLYGLMPIVRNTIAGLDDVDPAVVESARGMGLNARQRLARIQLPIAWPVILTGIRVTTVMIVGIAAIGAYVLGPGYGNMITDGLARVGSPAATNLVLAGILGVVLVAVALDALFPLLGRLTISKGLR